MKKLLCLLLVLVMCLACLTGCLGDNAGAGSGGDSTEEGGSNTGNNGGETGNNGGEAGNNGDNNGGSEKDLTAADLVARINEAVQKLNNYNPDDVTKDDILNEVLNIDTILELMQEVEWQVATQTEADGETSDSIIGMKNGVLYIGPSIENDAVYLTIQDGRLIAILPAFDGQMAEYYTIDEILDDMLTMPGADADSTPTLEFDMPLITEGDITADGNRFVIKNSYVINVIKAFIDALPDETIDEEGRASFKTMLPGLVDNLGLCIALETKGTSVVGFSLSFDANDDFRTLFGITAGTTIRGSYAMAYSDDGKHLTGLDIDMEIGGMFVLDAAIKTTYENDVLTDVGLKVHAEAPNSVMEYDYDSLYNEETGDWEYFDKEYYGDITVDADLTFDLTALQIGSTPTVRLIAGEINYSCLNTALYINGEKVTTPSAEDSERLASLTVEQKTTITSEKTGVDENAITITTDGVTTVITINLKDAPDFSINEKAQSLIDKADDFATIAKDIFAAFAVLEQDPAYGEELSYYDYYFVTEDGYLLSIFYFGEGNGQFEAYTDKTTMYNAIEIVYADGQYTVDADHFGGNPMSPFPDEEW